MATTPTKPVPLQGATKTTTGAKVGGLAAVVGVATAAILTPLITSWEDGPKGPALVPYPDIVGVWTQCSGETLGVTANSPPETRQGCAVKLDRRLAQDFAPAVLRCTPGLRGHPNQLAAAISLSYNIGTPGYCRSTVDRRFDSGVRNWASACDAFLLWNKAGGRVVKGLDNRRRAERALCLSELPR